jgi:tRNA dimethylallyltransferase
LRDQFGDLSHTAAQAIGYREAFAVLDGAMRVEEAMERTAVRTRQLAKRQMTWFRGQANVAWVDVDAQTDVDAVAEQVMILWERYGRTATRI